jgi:hypothetical protein
MYYFYIRLLVPDDDMSESEAEDDPFYQDKVSKRLIGGVGSTKEPSKSQVRLIISPVLKTPLVESFIVLSARGRGGRAPVGGGAHPRVRKPTSSARLGGGGREHKIRDLQDAIGLTKTKTD